VSLTSVTSWTDLHIPSTDRLKWVFVDVDYARNATSHNRQSRGAPCRRRSGRGCRSTGVALWHELGHEVGADDAAPHVLARARDSCRPSKRAGCRSRERTGASSTARVAAQLDEQQRCCAGRRDRWIRPAKRKAGRRHDPRVAGRGRTAAFSAAARCLHGPVTAAARKRSRADELGAGGAQQQPRTTRTPRRAVRQEESSGARRPDERFATFAIAGRC